MAANVCSLGEIRKTKRTDTHAPRSSNAWEGDGVGVGAAVKYKRITRDKRRARARPPLFEVFFIRLFRTNVAEGTVLRVRQRKRRRLISARQTVRAENIGRRPLRTNQL